MSEKLVQLKKNGSGGEPEITLTYLYWSNALGTNSFNVNKGDYILYEQFNGSSDYSFTGADILASITNPSGGGYNQYLVIAKATSTTVSIYHTGNVMISKMTIE